MSALLIWFKIDLEGSVQAEIERALFHPLVYSPYTCNSSGWVRIQEELSKRLGPSCPGIWAVFCRVGPWHLPGQYTERQRAVSLGR